MNFEQLTTLISIASIILLVREIYFLYRIIKYDILHNKSKHNKPNNKK